LYNKAYVIIESNDQGSVVCNGLYHDLEYEEIHLSSAIKSTGIGVEITRRTKRIGCSAFKDLIEEKKINVVDEQTILEISTFEAKGQSWEASDGNHDDLVMNLVLFGYYVTTSQFLEMTDINIKQMMYDQRIAEIEADVPPFGFHDDGIVEVPEVKPEDPWSLLDYKEKGVRLELTDW